MEERIREAIEEATKGDTIVPIVGGETRNGRWVVTGGLVGWAWELWRRWRHG